jgi:SAM-dependent methyltransferase
MEKMIQQRESEKAHYGRFQQAYDALTPRAYERLLDAALKGVESPWVLDLGGGSGAFGRRLSARGFRVVEADLSVELLRAGQNSDPQGTRAWLGVDALRLPFADGSLPVIFLGSVLHHFEDFTPLVLEVKRCLAPGGWCLSADPNGVHWMMWLLRNPSSPLFSRAGRSENERWLGPEDVVQVFASSGFEPTEVRGVAGVGYRLATFCNSEEDPPWWAKGLMVGWNILEEILALCPWRPLWFSSWMVFQHRKPDQRSSDSTKCGSAQSA